MIIEVIEMLKTAEQYFRGSSARIRSEEITVCRYFIEEFSSDTGIEFKAEFKEIERFAAANFKGISIIELQTQDLACRAVTGRDIAIQMCATIESRIERLFLIDFL